MAIFHKEAPLSQKSDRSAGDRLRHKQKVRKSIQENIADIISEESIIGKSSDKIIKVPIRGIKEFRFTYGNNDRGVGQGDGSGTVAPGDVIGNLPKDGQGGDGGAGSGPGDDYYETDVTLEELIEIMFEDLELPEMERKALKSVLSLRLRKPKGYRKKGIRARLDKHETAKARVRRKLVTDSIHSREREIIEGLAKSIATGDEVLGQKALSEIKSLKEKYVIHSDLQSGRRRFPFNKDDLIYKHVVTDIREESNAVVFCLMDTSGSMDTIKKYLARSFFFLLYQFIKSRYQNVELVFIAHHTEAKEVTEDEFFKKVESGGTYISSAYLKLLEIVSDRYHPTLWNIYAFHCSDGDNFVSDDSVAIKAASQICEIANLFGYGEIKPDIARSYESSMIEKFKKIDAPNFIPVTINRKEDVWQSFKKFLTKEVNK